MTATNCKTVRREIDEADLNQQLSNLATEHLQACPDCCVFHSGRHGLRSLVSSLETVAAPADFDFRLRARLAREKGRANGVFAPERFSFGGRSLAAAALVLLIAVAGIIVRNRMASTSSPAAADAHRQDPTVGPAGKEIKETVAAASSSHSPTASVPSSSKNSGGLAAGPRPKQRRRGKLPENGSPSSSVTLAQNNVGVRDSGLDSAPRLVPNESTDAIRVPIDAPSLKISFDDGRGTAHTISLPVVSFGSQRVLERGPAFAPVKSTRGVW